MSQVTYIDQLTDISHIRIPLSTTWVVSNIATIALADSQRIFMQKTHHASTVTRRKMMKYEPILCCGSQPFVPCLPNMHHDEGGWRTAGSLSVTLHISLNFLDAAAADDDDIVVDVVVVVVVDDDDDDDDADDDDDDLTCNCQ